jgi:hypothetical protein
MIAVMTKLKEVSADSVMNVAWLRNAAKEVCAGNHIELR